VWQSLAEFGQPTIRDLSMVKTKVFERCQSLQIGQSRHVISSRDDRAIAAAANSFDLLLVTSNVSLNWPAMLKTLKPNGRMHVVGVVPEPLGIPAISLIFGQKSVSGSPTGSPVTIATMLDFAARHKIAPQVEYFPMSQANDALARLAAGKARYRIVLNANQ
jgi:uncharacterized zinc-type alcohol dehydrogenase-like protein